jgi:hypothetical protein
VPIGAPWCTLCFADLRQPQPVASGAVAVPAQASPEPAAPAAPPVAPASPPVAPASPPVPVPDPADPLGVAALVSRPDAGERSLGWPCTGCGETVSFDMTFCPECGSSFLPTEREAVSFRLPWVGDMTKLSKGEKLVVIFGGMALVTTVFFLLAMLVGSIL